MQNMEFSFRAAKMILLTISLYSLKKLENLLQLAPRDMNLGGRKYGIWGLCLSEILHQFHEGVVGYVLQEFLDKKFSMMPMK